MRAGSRPFNSHCEARELEIDLSHRTTKAQIRHYQNLIDSRILAPLMIIF